MTTVRRLRPVAALVVAVMVPALGACTSDSEPDRPESDAPVVQLGAPGESNRTLSPGEVEELEQQPQHTEADVTFVQGMIPHHQQALRMTALVDERTASGQVPKLAERIEVSQTDEIAQLEGWLTARGESLPDEHSHHHGDPMPGMLTEEEFAQLEAAQGRRFDRLFLSYMIRHHQGAVLMVGQLLAGGGGQDAEAFQLAQHIESDQVVEISRMKRMLVDGSY
ncbi:MAG TPA: DUF305 domain-containing protein [Nocardioides sp.]|nr:DUF305 domain-containing protein [Nocardioides sp.]